MQGNPFFPQTDPTCKISIFFNLYKIENKLLMCVNLPIVCIEVVCAKNPAMLWTTWAKKPLYGILSQSENNHSKDFIVTPHQNLPETNLKLTHMSKHQLCWSLFHSTMMRMFWLRELSDFRHSENQLLCF